MKLTSLLALVALGAVHLLVGLSSAQAASGQLLPFSYLTDIEVDDAHSRVFLSGDGSLVSVDLTGHLTADPSLSNVGRIARTPDGNSLVITRSSAGGDGQIAVLDPATRNITKTITLPAGCSVGDIAPASGKVFFYSFCTGYSAWKIGAVDLSTGVVTLGLQTPQQGYSGTLYPVPGAPSLLVTWINDKVIVYDTTGGLTPTASVRASRVLQPHDLVLTPDGSQVVVSRTGSSTLLAYSPTDLAQVGEYAAGDADALAVRGDGVVASVNSSLQTLSYFPAETFDPEQVRTFSYGNYFSPGSLAFGAKRLYEVRNIGSHLEMFVDTPGPPAILKISPAASAYGYGAAPSVNVSIISPTTSRAVDLYAKPSYGGTKKLVKTVDVGSDGTVTTTMPKAYLNTIYTAEFEGDEDFSASSATTTAKIRPQIVISTASTSKSSYFHKLAAVPYPSVFVKVLPGPPASGCLTIVYQRYTSTGWVTYHHADCVSRTNGNSYKTRFDGNRGQKIRISATLRKSGFNADASSSWYYILLT